MRRPPRTAPLDESATTLAPVGQGGAAVRVASAQLPLIDTLISAAKADGVALFVTPTGGWRSRTMQAANWSRQLAAVSALMRLPPTDPKVIAVARGQASYPGAPAPVAPPGASGHEEGLAVDFGPASAYGWLARRAPAFGWWSYAPEPWHWERALGAAGSAGGATGGVLGFLGLAFIAVVLWRWTR